MYQYVWTSDNSELNNKFEIEINDSADAKCCNRGKKLESIWPMISLQNEQKCKGKNGMTVSVING